MSLALSELKRNKAYLLGVLGVDKAGQHVKCPFHDDTHGSLAIFQSEDGVWRWKCHGCDQGGSVIDAAILAYNAKGAKDAVRAIEGNLGLKIFRDEAPAVPVIDMARAEAAVTRAHADLLDSFDAMALLEEKRNITGIETIKRFRLGYLDNASFPEYSSWSFTGWMLPVTDKHGRLVAVKVHSESRHGKDWRATKNMPKCLWAPFGTHVPPGAKKPLHGWSTLWPGPEGCEGGPLLLTGGELKAIRLCDAGHHATAPTAGENKMPPHLINRIKAAKPSEVFVVFDADPAGESWRDKMIKHLGQVGIPCSAIDLTGNIPSPADLDAEWKTAATRELQSAEETIIEIERTEEMLKSAPENMAPKLAAQHAKLVRTLEAFYEG